MAGIEPRIVDEVIETKVKKEDGVILELTAVEARALSFLLASVGGGPLTTARGITDRIYNCLRDCGYPTHPRYSAAGVGYIIFLEKSLELFGAEEEAG